MATCLMRHCAVYLCLSEHEGGGHLEALGPGQVLIQLELVLQLQQLLAGEGRSGPPTLPHQTCLRICWEGGEERKEEKRREERLDI